MSDFIELVDLAAERLGGSVLWATDDFFAEKENLLKAEAAIFIDGVLWHSRINDEPLSGAFIESALAAILGESIRPSSVSD